MSKSNKRKDYGKRTKSKAKQARIEREAERRADAAQRRIANEPSAWQRAKDARAARRALLNVADVA